MEITALSWNLFHGRDAPPEPELLTWRSRLLRRTERGAGHAQVTRDLYASFSELLAGAEWDVALLQECPPRWAERLATDCRAEPHLVLTSRNLSLVGAVQALAADFNPDLIASWEGGCNLTLVRARRVDRSPFAERRMLTLRRRPERRAMAFSRLEAGFCVANLHASGPHELAGEDVLEAAAVAEEWAMGMPLILGGDFNVRPAGSRPVFDELAAVHDLTAPTGERAIDHLLVSGLAVVEAPVQWAPRRREVPDPTASGGQASLPIRLSDHAPVQATFALPDEEDGGA